MIGPDAEKLLAMWDRFLLEGGIPWPEREDGSPDEVRMAVLSSHLPAAPRIDPIVVAVGNLTVKVQAPAVYRYDFEQGRLVKARARGAETDLIVESAARDGGGCEFRSLARFSDAVGEICDLLGLEPAGSGECRTPLQVSPGGDVSPPETVLAPPAAGVEADGAVATSLSRGGD